MLTAKSFCAPIAVVFCGDESTFADSRRVLAYCCSRGLLLASVVGQAHCCSVVIVNNKNTVQLPTFGNPNEVVGDPVNEVYGASPPSSSSGTVSGTEMAERRADCAARRRSLSIIDFSVEARVDARTLRERASWRERFFGELDIPPPN